MKNFSLNLKMFALLVLFGISPIQSINAAVSNCMEKDSGMHHRMMMSHMNMQHDMSKAGSESGSKPDCCKQSKSCHIMHCASVPVAMMMTNPTLTIKYTVNKIPQTYKTSPVNFYPPSLYRPPKA